MPVAIALLLLLTVLGTASAQECRTELKSNDTFKELSEILGCLKAEIGALKARSKKLEQQLLSKSAQPAATSAKHAAAPSDTVSDPVTVVAGDVRIAVGPCSEDTWSDQNRYVTCEIQVQLVENSEAKVEIELDTHRSSIRTAAGLSAKGEMLDGAPAWSVGRHTLSSRNPARFRMTFLSVKGLERSIAVVGLSLSVGDEVQLLEFRSVPLIR